MFTNKSCLSVEKQAFFFFLQKKVLGYIFGFIIPLFHLTNHPPGNALYFKYKMYLFCAHALEIKERGAVFTSIKKGKSLPSLLSFVPTVVS